MITVNTQCSLPLCVSGVIGAFWLFVLSHEINLKGPVHDSLLVESGQGIFLGIVVQPVG